MEINELFLCSQINFRFQHHKIWMEEALNEHGSSIDKSDYFNLNKNSDHDGEGQVKFSDSLTSASHMYQLTSNEILTTLAIFD